MKDKNLKMIKKLMLTLLPVQVLLVMVDAIDNIISSYFASNYVGIEAMSAVGLYGPINMLYAAVGLAFSGGSAILCAKYLGRNDHEKMQSIFSLNIIITALIAIGFTAFLVIISIFDFTTLITKNETIRPIFDRYLLGQALGIFPFIIGNQLPTFLTLENKQNLSLAASIAYVILDFILSFIFVQVLGMEELGLALATSIGLWAFLLIQLSYFLTSKAHFRLEFKKINWKEVLAIIAIGFPGTATFFYQTIRGFILNNLLETHTGTYGLSAFSATYIFLGLFLAIPIGMITVSRLLIGIAEGEQDRHTMIDVMKVMLRYYVPIMIVIVIGLILLSRHFTYIFFKDENSLVFNMMVNGLRIIPLSMPFNVFIVHFICYGQTMNKQFYTNVLSILDGLIEVIFFAYLLINPLDINGVYLAFVLCGITSIMFIVGYAWYKNKRMPKSLEDLMVIPNDFGVNEEDRIDISVDSMEEVVNLSRQINDFCISKGVDEKRTYLASLAMEEIAGNVVEHGFNKDNKKHTIDCRVVYKDDEVILRIKDDCIPFDPKERKDIIDNDDIVKNVGIRMIYKLAKDIDYQNILGLNVLTIKI